MAPFDNHRDAALALLNLSSPKSRTEGSFLGQLAVDSKPLSWKQADWLAKLLKRDGLPPLRAGGAS